MTEIAQPNWLVIGGVMYLMCAVGLLAKCAIGISADAKPTVRASGRTDALFSLPFLAAGAVTLVLSQFYVAELGAPTVLFMLVLAFALLLYVGYEGWLETAEAVQSPSHEAVRPVLRLASPKPTPAPAEPNHALGATVDGGAF